MKKFLTTLLVAMLVLIISVVFIVSRSLSPFNQAEAETIELAERRADLVEARDFYWFNGEETFFTVTGENSLGDAIVVIVQQEGGAIEVLDEAETISKQEVMTQTIAREEPEKILEARIGMFKDEPIWEVSYRLENGLIGYTTWSLRSGEWIRTIKNI